MKDLTKIYIDLSKCTEEQIKALPQIFENSGDKVLPETLSDLISGKITDGFKFLFYHPSGWNQNDYPLNGRNEITYPEFIRLFEDGESDGWIKIESEADLPKDSNHVEFFVIINKFVTTRVFYNGKFVNDYQLNIEEYDDLPTQPTHYQPIQKPLPPKF